MKEIMSRDQSRQDHPNQTDHNETRGKGQGQG
jgi:hypothetical protein